MYIKNLNKACRVKKGDTILDVLKREKIDIPSPCNGNGTCGKCKVAILDREGGELKGKELEIENEANDKSNLKYQLACKISAEDDMVIFLPKNDKEVDRKSRISNELYRADFVIKSRLNNQVGKKSNYVEASDEESLIGGCRLGIAFDIGTTTIVGMLCDIENGCILNTISKRNSQCAYGADIISRAQYANLSEENSTIMQNKVIDDCNEIILQLCEAGSKKIKEGIIERVFFVGNTIMSHLLLGKSTKKLVRFPFKPFFSEMVKIEANKLGIRIKIGEAVQGNDVKEKEVKYTMPESTQAVILPNLGGQVGSDILAGILAVDLKHRRGNYLFIDIGTNGEIVLKKDEMMITCSTAAGPAFEGASIFQGMRAVEGAIEAVNIVQDGFNESIVQCSVIGCEMPVGICGSGIIDVVAELLKVKIIDETGRMLTQEEARAMGVEEELAERIITIDKGLAFILYRGGEVFFPSLRQKNKKKISDIANDDIRNEMIVITQKDIREIQLAKAAIYAGIVTLLKKLGLSINDLDEILVAGAFGNYINIKSAVAIGLLPQTTEGKIIGVGNAAGYGVSLAMLNKDLMEEACNLAERMEQIELSLEENFQDVYIESMNFII